MDGIVADANTKIIKSVRKCFKYAVERGIRDVIFYGDLCEKARMSYEFQVALYTLLLDTKWRDLRMHFILGNHDFQENGSHSLEVLKVVSNLTTNHIRVYTEQTLVKIGGRKFNMMPHPVLDTRRDSLNIGHFEVKNSYRDNGRQIDHGFTTPHKCCVGHLHTNHRVRRVHYSGTLYQTNFGESLPKYFHHVRYEDDDPYAAEVENVPFEPPWKLLNLEVETEEDLLKIENDPDTLYKLFIHEGLNLDIDDVLREHPNVVRHNKFKNKEDLKELIEQEWDFSTNAWAEKVDTREVLTEYMTKKSGLNKQEVKRAFKLFDRIVNKQVATVEE
jgi:hypothetical protein